MAKWKTHLQRVIEHHGSQARLAEVMGCSQSKVSWLVVTADRLSAEDAIALENAAPGIVSRSDFRPDLWPKSEHAA